MPVISRWIDIGGYLSKVTQSISSRFFPTPSGTEKRDIFEFVKSSNFPFSKNRFDIRRTSIDRIIMILGIWYLEPIVNNDCTRIRKVFLNFLQRDLRCNIRTHARAGGAGLLQKGAKCGSVFAASKLGRSMFDEMRMRVTRTHRVSLAFWNRLKIIRAPANNTAYYHKRCLSV